MNGKKDRERHKPGRKVVLERQRTGKGTVRETKDGKKDCERQKESYRSSIGGKRDSARDKKSLTGLQSAGNPPLR